VHLGAQLHEQLCVAAPMPDAAPLTDHALAGVSEYVPDLFTPLGIPSWGMITFARMARRW
jgi:hypothetical protein